MKLTCDELLFIVDKLLDYDGENEEIECFITNIVSKCTIEYTKLKLKELEQN